jgi:hypothetical protein
MFLPCAIPVCPLFQLDRVLDRTARSHSLNVKLGALGEAWSVETGIHGQLKLEYSVGQLELEY